MSFADTLHIRHTGLLRKTTELHRSHAIVVTGMGYLLAGDWSRPHAEYTDERFNIARLPASHRVRVTLATRTLVSYVPVQRATARALAELGCSAFFIGGVASAALGSAGPWAVLAVVLLSGVLRASDLEARALFVPGGLYGSVRETVGRPLATMSASALLVDRLMLGALAAVVAGHYLVAFGSISPRQPQARD